MKDPTFYVKYLEEFIGKEWIEQEFEKIEKKSKLKEIGGSYENYHPFVQFRYEIRYLLRHAEAFKENEILLRENHSILANAGYLLYINFDKIPNKKDTLMRLRDAKKFHDVIWELEVATMFAANQVEYQLRDPAVGATNDICCHIDNRFLEVECKNKVVEDPVYAKNQIFAHMLVNKFSNIATFYGKTIEIRYEEAFYEDIKQVVSTAAKMLNKVDYCSICGKYRISNNKKYQDKSPQYLMSKSDIRGVMVVKETSRKKLYTYKESDAKTKMRFVLKYPDEKTDIKNLETVLSKANTQLCNGGVVFLHVPFHSFDEAKAKIENILRISSSNIMAVKLVSLDTSNDPEHGVKISRKEELILSERSKYKLTEKEIEFLSKNIAFSKYREEFKHVR